jgi:putative transposase
VSYSWTLKGERKVVPYENPEGRRANAISVYLPFGRQSGGEQGEERPELWWDVVGHTLRAQDVLLILEAIPRGKGALVVVLDNASIHISHVVKDAMARLRRKGIHLYYLPPYSPELNLIEPFLGVVKYTEMPERSYRTVPSLMEAIDQAFMRCEQRLLKNTQHHLRLGA